ncbi:regulatory signaling modulator protein AmpE [Microbulbifer thermotolerans]|uniref:regulatory signaling modulator protein AmpE n=1 Tax=Microbulbifer thermotolerans TaxID=252514 RepID=UPI002248F579|nr:regulatory signaling modulator protein AmpE [Microbulbifer thermotolerans]MCX2778984.1 regulatory signaling modulator protein AmpE [Microbulbifer thermotolerans]MCX2781505.1 regulatory signaling modulator protein AmpE [Microbulbifer thermotolerans]MCX2795744.1 regulatory signaling modulator protein AmpE [Microbulbifer thermotolerans]MCX2804718.1 regulatory signaling modulator protein AmpE [Microbulbifer thermotolerans]MCX2831400.1 regulatory signaling modulator protein AmpE [Microbulbifer t
MALLIVLLALGLVQLWGSGAPLHRDGWFRWWRGQLDKIELLHKDAGLMLAACVLPPVLFSAVLMVLAEALLGGLGSLLVGVPLLLYCLGRGNFSEILSNYLRNWYKGDLAAAREAAAPLMKELHEEPADSRHLHEQVFRGAAYCAFERLFAVLFWFFLLGIPGAVLFRLSALYAELSRGGNGGAAAERWLWLLEWLPVRVMGFSFAIVGNFVGCYRAWRQCLTCRERDTDEVLETYLEGALGGIDASECSAGAEVAEGQRICGAQLEGLQALLSRSLLLWITVMALAVLFGF